MRIGVFGGSFDPVHYGHMILAEQCREQVDLDELWVIPAARPPHKAHQSCAPFADRAEMLRLAFADQPDFRVDTLEVDRPGPSYTADTLDEMHRRTPDAELFLLIGSDCLHDLSGWHEPRRIIQRATLVVMERPGSPMMTAEKLGESLQLTSSAVDGAVVKLFRVEVPLIDLSSRDIRRRVAEGRSIHFMVPPAVEKFILERELY